MKDQRDITRIENLYTAMKDVTLLTIHMWPQKYTACDKLDKKTVVENIRIQLLLSWKFDRTQNEHTMNQVK